MIVDYYDTIERSGEYSPYVGLPTNYLRSERPKTCPNCKEELSLTDRNTLIEELDLHEYVLRKERAEHPMTTLELRECRKCGWWHVNKFLKDTEHYGMDRTYLVNSIIKKFDISLPSTPVKELANYLTSNIDNIYHIHHKKMEELVGSILREHYDCEVFHCGQSHDRGIDLLMVEGKDLIPIQVKRRMSPGKTEGVRVVREMLGVMFRDQQTKSMIVTSADKFSKEAQQEANEVSTRSTANRIDLVNLGHLHSMMKNHFGNQKITPKQKIKQMC